MQDIFTYTMLLSIISFTVASSFTPGPNNIMLLSSGLTFGYKRTLGHIFGIVIGFPLMVIAVGFGVGAIFERYPLIYSILKVAGILYLLWMAWHIAKSKGDISIAKEKNNKPFTFIQISLFQWVNPKAWIMAVTATTSFTTAGDYFFMQVLIIALTYSLVCLASSHMWVLGGVFLQKFISNESRVRIFNISMALLLVLSIVPILFE
ncbi:Transporter, LysE family [hydrothermal vent metagenome]|uniref:Transporter, LysE family n=1 Tax=hydrothermal vent metagenome TaxID=652676 RepID=A0A1W1EBY7_9ZZZZ